MPGDGHQISPWVAISCPREGLGEGGHPLAGGGFFEAVGVTLGEDDVGVVQEPVHPGGGEGGGHEFVEPSGPSPQSYCNHMPRSGIHGLNMRRGSWGRARRIVRAHLPLAGCEGADDERGLLPRSARDRAVLKHALFNRYVRPYFNKTASRPPDGRGMCID